MGSNPGTADPVHVRMGKSACIKHNSISVEFFDKGMVNYLTHSYLEHTYDMIYMYMEIL